MVYPVVLLQFGQCFFQPLQLVVHNVGMQISAGQRNLVRIGRVPIVGVQGYHGNVVVNVVVGRFSVRGKIGFILVWVIHGAILGNRAVFGIYKFIGKYFFGGSFFERKIIYRHTVTASVIKYFQKGFVVSGSDNKRKIMPERFYRMLPVRIFQLLLADTGGIPVDQIARKLHKNSVFFGCQYCHTFYYIGIYSVNIPFAAAGGLP